METFLLCISCNFWTGLWMWTTSVPEKFYQQWWVRKSLHYCEAEDLIFDYWGNVPSTCTWWTSARNVTSVASSVLKDLPRVGCCIVYKANRTCRGNFLPLSSWRYVFDWPVNANSVFYFIIFTFKEHLKLRRSDFCKTPMLVACSNEHMVQFWREWDIWVSFGR